MLLCKVSGTIFTCVTTVALMACLAPFPTYANDFTGADDLRWFNDLNWNDGHTPLPAEDAEIGGFEVHAYVGHGDTLQCYALDIADYYLPGFASLYSELPIVANNLSVGGVRFQAGNHSGELTVVGADVILTSGVEIAKTSSGPNDTGEGHVAITDGSLHVDGYIEVGYAFQGGGNSTGSLAVTNGDIIDTYGGDVIMGRNSHNSPGFADGSVRLENGRMDGFEDAVIGYSSSGTGGSTGTMALINSEAYFEYDVDVSDGSDCTGLLTLDNSYFEPGYMSFGTNSTTQFHVDGVNRVSPGNVNGPNQYSAIDLSNIYGSSYGIDIAAGARLEVHFGYTPSDGASFDLIRLLPGQSFNGGTFTDVAFFDLDPSFEAVYEIIPGDSINGEIVRITLASVSAVEQMPTRGFTLHANVPNPFNPSTMLSFEMAAEGHARLSVYNAAGRLVTTLVDEQRGVGRHEFVWNGQNTAGQSVASGVYLYRLEAGDVVQTKRMMLVK